MWTFILVAFLSFSFGAIGALALVVMVWLVVKLHNLERVARSPLYGEALEDIVARQVGATREVIVALEHLEYSAEVLRAVADVGTRRNGGNGRKAR